MLRKKVFIDDCLIGEAATWREVDELTKALGIFFIGGARGAEGPSGFFLATRAIERPQISVQRPAVG